MSLSPLEALRAAQKELTTLLSDALTRDAFANRYTLHPRRLSEMAAEEAGEFLAFVETGDEARPARRGQALADEGLGDAPLSSIPAILHAFVSRTLAGAGVEAREQATESVDRYSRLLLGSFINERVERTLADQEQLRRALTAALQTQSRELLTKDHAISTSINGIILAGLDGRVTYVNPSFLALWGYASVDEVLGRPMQAFWKEEEAEAVLAALPRTGGWRGELTARRKDGSTLTVALAASVVKDAGGQAIGIMASSVDMTEARRLQTQMQQVQKMDALGQLAGGIAHDFNNLLTVISGHLQLLLLEVSPDTQMHHDIQQIQAAVERGTALTRQLRFFTHQATGRRQLINLNDVTRETYELFKRTLPPEITITLSPGQGLWTVEADPNQMSQVLVNLCVNARDAIQERRASLKGRRPGGTVTIRTQNIELTESQASHYVDMAPGRYVRLRVSDTGVGIAPPLLDKLFIPFVTTKESRRGTGLGLAVVYGIVRGHRGMIDVESRLGEGSTFSVYLPVAGAAADRPEAEAPPVLASGAGTILVVDDEPQVRDIIVRTLTRCGYKTVEADNGKTALSVLEERGTDVRLVILDVVMPEMDGREAFDRIQRMIPGLPVLLITGHTLEPDAGDLTYGGAAELMEKPLDLKLFTEKVQTMLGSTCPEL